MENSDQHLKSVVLLRKELHKHPEVSGEEFNTAKRIVSFLEKYSPDEIITGVGNTGIIAVYKGLKPGKTVLFRCELDALPIEEINTFEYRSLIDGVSHKCGHDGHMAILCGLAIELHYKRPESGTVILLFQPAEEDGKGAKNIIADTKFSKFQPDYVYALHNLPGYPKNQVVVKDGTFTCAVNSIIIKLNGITAHAGEPEKGINPALAIATIIKEYNEFIQPDISKKGYCQITPIYSQMGKKAYGISAGAGEIHFTVRCDSNDRMSKTETVLENIAESIANEFRLNCSIEWTQSFHANENNPEAVNFIKQSAIENDFEILEKEHPFTWGEDFGLFTQNYPGAMFGIGSGTDSPALHNPDYDFPDDIILTGVTLFHHISKLITDAD